MNSPKRRWPAIEDLDAEERVAFEDFLAGSQMPINSDGSQGYYPGDYERFKRYQQRNKN
ncbi:hypothetical protein [Photobacterium chitinilyticum]|uniref:hypothetical protein n=1 Tax=Photobacterium chitinilyticum TaxID=2485123 RepID=UPI0013E89A88|nr:hypothetical protein [Photobacterium chitinilyticum]